jgi:hypothetical protein
MIIAQVNQGKGHEVFRVFENIGNLLSLCQIARRNELKRWL